MCKHSLRTVWGRLSLGSRPLWSFFCVKNPDMVTLQIRLWTLQMHLWTIQTKLGPCKLNSTLYIFHLELVLFITWITQNEQLPNVTNRFTRQEPTRGITTTLKYSELKTASFHSVEPRLTSVTPTQNYKARITSIHDFDLHLGHSLRRCAK